MQEFLTYIKQEIKRKIKLDPQKEKLIDMKIISLLKKDNNLINYETYGTIELTDEGENLAKKILEVYDIVYIFLKDVLNISSKEAQQQAEQIKQSITDNTLNHLAKYVHKVLGLTNLDCGYDINKEKCRACARRKVNKNEKIINN